MTDDLAGPDRDPHPKNDARRLDDYVAAELAALPAEDDRPTVRRRGEPMPASQPTPGYRAWLRRRAVTT